jgi:hypothetical protein
MENLSIEDIEEDYKGTAFEGISFVLDTHSRSFEVLADSSKQPDDFVSILNSLLEEDKKDLQSKIFSEDNLHIVDVLRYVLDIIDFFETSLTTKIRSEDPVDEWQIYEDELAEVSRNMGNLTSSELQSSFDSPLDFLSVKSQTVKQIITILSYQGNEPQEGDFFTLDTGDDSYIYGQITEEVSHKKQVLEGNYYKYDLLAYDTDISSHELVEDSDEEVIRPAHSSRLEIFKTNMLFNSVNKSVR